MKIIKYTLNIDGTVPDYVIDGGYLAVSNNGISPQNLDLVGLAINEAPQSGFTSKLELLSYANEKNIVFKEILTEEIIPLERVVSNIWDKLQ
jgi:hypothetical protein